jgi:glutathione S-transferase
MLSMSTSSVPSWESLTATVRGTSVGIKTIEQESLRAIGEGLPHTDAALRLFGTTAEPRVTFFRDTAAWCPYCQKVWILLEEKRIPYKVQKINMRSYGDKPAEFLRRVPNGLLPAIELDGVLQTDSLPIMMNLERTFSGGSHPQMWPSPGTKDDSRAQQLMRLERDLFARWCNLVFRPSLGGGSRKVFEEGLDLVDKELAATKGPWFLDQLSIVDLTYVSHIERMAASVPYWSGFLLRGQGRWPNIDRWFVAFEQLPSYMATKSDYYTHVQDIPPQYGPGYSPPGMDDTLAKAIDGRDGSWKLPLAPLSEYSIEPYSAAINPGDEAARHEAAYKVCKNYSNLIKFALRGAGTRGAKGFQAPLADPYAVPKLDDIATFDAIMRVVVNGLVQGESSISAQISEVCGGDKLVRSDMKKSLAYLRVRVGVPRDLSYPAARQLRAYVLSAEEGL